MYTLNNLDSILDIVSYTVSAMKESDYSETDIDEYINNVVLTNNYDIIQMSKEIISDCNSLVKEHDFNDLNSDNDISWFEDTWRDSYYSSLWDDDSYDYPNQYKYKLNNDSEFYEGFDSCGYVDDEDFKVGGYHNPDIFCEDNLYNGNKKHNLDDF